MTDEDELIALLSNCEPTDENVSRVAQTALHDGFAAIAERCDLSQPKILTWLYGLLCVLSKPLLPDQAADLNLILANLLEIKKQRPYLKAQVNLNIAIITEHFD